MCSQFSLQNAYTRTVNRAWVVWVSQRGTVWCSKVVYYRQHKEILNFTELLIFFCLYLKNLELMCNILIVYDNSNLFAIDKQDIKEEYLKESNFIP